MESVEVSIEVDPKRRNYGRRATPCEVLFGIIPGSSLISSESNLSDDGSELVSVRGFTPDGEAVKNDSIRIGDFIKSVNGVEVNCGNIAQVLSTIKGPGKVKLVLQRVIPAHPVESNCATNVMPQSPLVRQITGEKSSLDEIAALQRTIPHIAMYLKIQPRDSEDSADNGEGISYQYPDYATVLTSLRGMFITLIHMITDVTVSEPLSSTLVVEEQLVHVGYSYDKRGLFVLVLPADGASTPEIQQMTADITRLLEFQYQTLDRAFNDQMAKSALDHFFSLFFHYALGGRNSSKYCQEADRTSRFASTLSAVQWLPLPPEAQMEINTALGEFESADFGDMSEAYYGTQRFYTILGCCLFYKGYLLSSHLPVEDLQDIYLYAYYYKLLILTRKEAVSQVVVWKEVFPTRRRSPQNNDELGFAEPDARWFLLIVALRHNLLAVLLEAGGCAAKAEGHPQPDPFYVDQAHNTLVQLEAAGVSALVEKWLDSPPAPPLASADTFVSKGKTSKFLRSHESLSVITLSSIANLAGLPKKDDLPQKSLSQSSLLPSGGGWSNQGGTSGSKKMQEVTMLLRKRTSPDGERQHLLSPAGFCDAEADGDISHAPSAEDTPVLGHRHLRDQGEHTSTSSDAESRASSEGAAYRGLRSRRKFASSYDLSSLRKSLEETESNVEDDVQKLVAGSENTLFHYIHLDNAEGVFLAPTAGHDRNGVTEPIHAEILNNFEKCCLDIRRVFQQTLKAKEMSKKKEVPKFGMDRSLLPAKEHGVLFNYTHTSNNPKKGRSTIVYWVVGRLFLAPEPREVYVCFHDSASQNMVELAFRLGFGLLP